MPDIQSATLHTDQPASTEPTEDATYILYAEDNPSDAAFFLRSLDRCDPDLRIVHCENGMLVRDYLLTCIDRHQPLPSLVILDIKMPGMTGLEVLEFIRSTSELHLLPTIILSASAENRDRTRAYSARANAYLVKPERYQQLKSLVEAIVLFWIHHNQVPK